MSRNRKPLTLGEKLRIIEEAEKRNGATKASIARDLNIPVSSLKTILAKKDSMRQMRQRIAVDGAILKEKTETVALRCSTDDFKASNGWLDRFKKRSGVVYSRCCGESASVSSDTVEKWTALLPELIQEYKLSDVFNADETGQCRQQ
ncbi:hypothetical protein HPB52_021476 [Rhipicephalus sanguineus]|uniref:HTH CENPB-type domain-containing protein n=1 Tax=Rhipicephalus sanguineus TaxID=34632 RepID=A0A9D4T7Y6_RHISA|nr:hypothetical protein HPB52_021476 [Rhipicephalus sanguineus]